MIYNSMETLDGNVFSDLVPGGGGGSTSYNYAPESYAPASYAPVPAPAPAQNYSAKQLKALAHYAAMGAQNAAKAGTPYIPDPIYVAAGVAPAPVAAPVAAPAPVVAAPAPVVAAPVVTPAPGAASAEAPPVAATPTGPVLPPVVQIVRDTPGYQFQVQEGLDAINSNAYARGLGNSGVTFKALAEHGRKVADQYYQQYLTNVAAVAEQGRGAAGAVAGAGDNMGAGVAGALGNQALAQQNAANAAANNAYQRANATSSMVGSIAGALGNLGGAVAGSLGSSYGAPIGGGATALPAGGTLPAWRM